MAAQVRVGGRRLFRDPHDRGHALDDRPSQRRAQFDPSTKVRFGGDRLCLGPLRDREGLVSAGDPGLDQFPQKVALGAEDGVHGLDGDAGSLGDPLDGSGGVAAGHEELDRAVPDAVIGEAEGGHPELSGARRHRVDLVGAVEQRILAVDVQMRCLL